MRGNGSPWEGENRTDFTSGLEAGGDGNRKDQVWEGWRERVQAETTGIGGIWTTVRKPSTLKTLWELKG